MRELTKIAKKRSQFFLVFNSSLELGRNQTTSPGALDRVRIAWQIGVGIIPGAHRRRAPWPENLCNFGAEFAFFDICKIMPTRLERERKIRSKLLLRFLPYPNE